MNPVTFNLPFKPYMGGTVFDSPLVDYSKNELRFDPKDIDLVVDTKNLSVRLPFEEFRVFAKLGDTSMPSVISQMKAKELNDSYSGSVVMVFFHLPHVGLLSDFMFLYEVWIVPSTDGEERLNSEPISVRQRLTMMKGKTRHELNASSPEHKIRDQVSVMLCSLCCDFNNPHLYLCKKSPPLPQGHNVLWQRAREHYVLIHKTHPANSKEAVGKKLVTDGPTIDRAAHSRRAHFRLLRSPKFTHKRGQRVWVQSAWVGPKEWTDHSGQIYKIVERKNPLP